MNASAASSLQLELDKVASRYRRLRLATALSVAWILLALSALALTRSLLIALALLIAAAICTGWILLASSRSSRDWLWIAHRIEGEYPDLDSRLLAALEQQPDKKSNQLGYLQETVVREAVAHARNRGWESIVPGSRLRLAGIAQWATLLCFLIVLGLTIGQLAAHHGLPGWGLPAIASENFQIKVEPGDTSLERGTSLLVLARFNGRLPGDVQLLSRNADGKVHEAAMSKSLDDPLFASRVPTLAEDLDYAVRYGNTQTQWFKASVFDYPDLKQADAHLAYPGYTQLPAKDVKDVRSVTAVEGTKATITFRLNKPVAQVNLVAAATTQPSAIEAPRLVVDPKDPTLYSVSLDLKQSQRFHLQLVDADGRSNRQPPELAINVNPNKPPELKPIFPGHDVDVSPLQELSLRERVSDDFGVIRAGVSYSIAGGPPQEAVLSSNVPANQPREISDLLPLEKFNAQPDQLVSYYFWAEDFAGDGSIRRTSGDMFFAEVRPFEEIFRQGQQPSESEQQQQQQQSQQSNQNGQQAEQLAEQQKQIIAATWKVIRRETGATPTAEFVPDVNLIAQSQTAAHQQAAGMDEKLTDARSKAYLANVLNFMDRATQQLTQAAGTSNVAPLTTALSSEQAAYQELLKLRAREFDVVRGNRQQRGSQSGSSASDRRQQQLDQLQMENEQNRYESQRTAQQQENPEQRETRQVLSRLRELAQRQEDLNRQMRELQSALQRANDQVQKDEIQRQLARLRDQQHQQLRDTDDLHDRMDQPENQQRMADSRQQLEQTRENVRQASQSLEKGEVPQAAAAGARASEQLGNLRDQFRKNAAGQFTDAMSQMRQDARQLDEDQKALSEKLAKIDDAAQRSLRDNGDRQEISKQLDQQKQKLDQLVDSMRKTSEAAETDEPLLAGKLYDTLRQANEQPTAQALDASKQLLDRGFTTESRQAEGEAGKGISQLRKGVEQAASSVLGDETENLRQARANLNQLSDQLQREIDRNRGSAGADGAAPSTRPASDGNRIAGGIGPTTRDSQAIAEGRGPTTRGSGQLARDGQSSGQSQQDRQARDAQRQDQIGQGQARETQQARNQGAARQTPQDQQGQQQSQGGERQTAVSGESPQDGQAGQQGRSPSQQARAGRTGGLRGNPQDANQPQPGGEDQQQGQSQQARAGQGAGQPGNSQDGNPRQSGDPQTAQAQQGQSEQARAGRGGGLRGDPQNGNQPQPGSPGDQLPPGNSQQESPQVADAQQGDPRPGEAAPRDQQARANQSGQRGQSGGRGDSRAAFDGGSQGAYEVGNRIGGDETPDTAFTGPITGEGFRDWSDRMRDVEEMVTDSNLRDQAARVRERVREVRIDYKRHAKPPNWDMVNEQIGQPLAQLRDAVSQELLKHESNEALVPLDREAVPPQYAEQVRRYYERLGSGK